LTFEARLYSAAVFGVSFLLIDDRRPVLTTMTIKMPLLTVLVIFASKLFWGLAFDASFSTRTLPATSIFLVERTRWRKSLLYLQQDESIGDEENIPMDGSRGDIRNGLDTLVTLEEVETLEIAVPSVSIESANRNNRIESHPDPVEQIIDAFVSIKEKVYGTIRQILSDLVTIIKRSAKNARDWAVDDDVGQLVSSGLLLVGFFVFVAAFAAWNIELLSGGKSKWSGPKNGVTIPVVKGLPTTASYSEVESPVVVRFQKPKWKAPKIQASYSNDKVSNSKEDVTEILGSESLTR